MTASPERLEGTVDPKLLEILVCPLTKGPLEFDAVKQELISRRHPDHAAGRGEEDRVRRGLASRHTPIVIPAKAGIQYSPPSITY